MAPKQASTKGAVAADPYSWPFDGSLRPESTALLAINFHQDFLAADGGLARAGYQINSAGTIVERSGQVLRRMREAGCRIVHIRLGYDPELGDCPHGGQRFPAGASGPLGRCLIRGETGLLLRKFN